MDGGASDPRTAEVDARSAHGGTAKVALPDRWRLLELLGSGGQATVWLAEDRTLGQPVALKALHTEANQRTRGRWLEEVRQGRRLSHPNLIRIFDLVETSDRPVAVMEHVPGGTLADRIRDSGPQPVKDVVDWTRDALEVLAYLHEQRIVHRDVKPSNLLLTEDGRIKLSDLGLVRSLDRGSDLTRTMEGIGTPRFMAPEQLRGEQPTPACDLYSLGITMYQLLTGTLPFDGDSAYQIADQHLHRRPPGVRERRPDCPGWLARFVDRLLEKRPEDRFSSARRALAALDRRRVGFGRRSFWWAVSTAVAMIMVVLGMNLAKVWSAPSLDRIEGSEDEVVAWSKDNERLWSANRSGWIPTSVVGDFVGGGSDEVVVGWSPPNGNSDPSTSVVFELRADDGEVIRTIDTSGWGASGYFDIAPIWSLSFAAAATALGDGDDLVWVLHNPRWYSSMAGVTSFRSSDHQPVLLLANSGHVQKLTTADLDGDGIDEIVAVAINNPMGFQRVLVMFGARSRLTGESCTLLYSPDLDAFRQARSDVPEGCLTYTPLGSNVRVVEPAVADRSGIEVVVNGEIRSFDLWGNPEGSPTWGAGPGPRQAFWADLATTCSRLRLAERVEPPFSFDRLRADHPDVMSEQPMEVAAYLVAARALASGGHGENAIELLSDGVRRYPYERDLHLRLGEQLLIRGRRAEGRDRVAASVGIASSGRNHSDQTYMLILDAAVHGDRVAYEETRRFVANLALDPNIHAMRFLDVAWLFFQGEWTDPRLVDVDPHWVHLWVQLLKAWARFETDRDADAVLASASEFEQLPETRDLARLLKARVHLARDEFEVVGQLADAAHQNLTIRCRMDYEACVWLPAAEWLMGLARLGQGQADEGNDLLRRAAEHAPNTWLAQRSTP